MISPIDTNEKSHTRKKRNVLLFALFSSILLIGINYYTITILSDVRAYVNGESEYSKGQKDASFFLTAYIDLRDEAYWHQFNKSISVPIGDRIARVNLKAGSDDSVIARGFLAARNHPDDVAGMIWMFRTFQHTWFMEEPIAIWRDADSLNVQLVRLANDMHTKIGNRPLTMEEKENSVRMINALSSVLSEKEHAFSGVLGSKSRAISSLLLVANILFICVILGSLTYYVVSMMSKLDESNRLLGEKNIELLNASKELDTFVYSLSHDLRAPITSIKGLVYIAHQEPNPDGVKDYLVMIDGLIDKQDAFIKEIIDFFRNKRSSLVVKEVSLATVVDDVVNNNKYTELAQQMEIRKEVNITTIQCDELRLKMILNNLVSNAIKYSDPNKTDRWLVVRANRIEGNVVIEVEDNGVGIEKENFEKIFQMFFVTSNDNRGTGLGLYILKQNVEKLKGEISVSSEVNVGTKISVSLPAL